MSESLKDKGFIFGLGAFRRYEHHFDDTIGHFEETLKPTEEVVKKITEKSGLTADQISAIPVRTISDVESNFRWAAMLKFANDAYVSRNGGSELPIEEFENMLSEASQSDFDAVYNQFLDSFYMGKKLRVYYGIPEPPVAKGKAKKKSSASAKQ